MNHRHIEFFHTRHTGTGVWLKCRVDPTTNRISGFLFSSHVIRVSTRAHSISWHRPGTRVPFSVREARYLGTGKTWKTKLGTFHVGTR